MQLNIDSEAAGPQLPEASNKQPTGWQHGGWSPWRSAASEPAFSTSISAAEISSTTCGQVGKAQAGEEVSVCGAVSRTAVALSRPLSLLAAGAVFKFKLVGLFVAKKLALGLKRYLLSPHLLFRRQALSPWAALKGDHEKLPAAVKAELSAGGMRSITYKFAAPYLANAVVTMVMFQSYDVSSRRLHAL
eukprot:TRINITY_DN38826_c0_g1_i2.p1 TRINITY_DN38826_c0_g1~~TRINITY_DN38826_c0_g1_i2.p1  ORF type:complete len:189 (+),score=44.12 TRINITY_DN38826_c0_g1_i2:103-669(+)